MKFYTQRTFSLRQASTLFPHLRSESHNLSCKKKKEEQKEREKERKERKKSNKENPQQYSLM